METTPQDVSLAVREVASYFPDLSTCEPDVIKFLTKKMKKYLKQQRYLIRKAEGSANNENQNIEPMIKINAPKESDQLDVNSEPSKTSTEERSVLSPRKRALSCDPYEFDQNATEQSAVNLSSKSKKAKMCLQSKNVPIQHAENVDTSGMTGKEFSSQNSLNVKFEVGHFVVLGKDMDEYEFCRIDEIVYHKSSAKYYMNITYYQLIDGRLEVYPEPDSDKPWVGKKVPLNTVILNLRHTRLVDTDMKNKLRDITTDLYS